MILYLDWAATASPDEEIYREALEWSLKYPGNPSSQHELGTEAKERLEEDRTRCARVLRCPADRLFFTSGGSESNNLVILSRLADRNPGRMIISSLEHPSLSEPQELMKKKGAEVKLLKPEANGILSPDKLARLLDKNTRMVSLMAVHNETGAIQPIEELVQTVRDVEKDEGSRPIHFHSDMVQAPGKIPLDLEASGLDSASFSAHKLRGPKGVGLLYLKKDQAVLYRGGGQEKGIRPGTESLFNSHAMALSLEKWGKPWGREASDFLLSELKGMEKVLFNPPARREEPEHFAPSIFNISLPPLPGEVLQRILNEEGFAVSTGSACSSNKKSRTQGMLSMGVDEKTAHCSIRISLGPTTGRDELAPFTAALKKISQGYVF